MCTSPYVYSKDRFYSLRSTGLQYDYIPVQNWPYPQAMIVNPHDCAKLCKLKFSRHARHRNQGIGVELKKSQFIIRCIKWQEIFRGNIYI